VERLFPDVKIVWERPPRNRVAGKIVRFRGDRDETPIDRFPENWALV
jgi:hypothetical protein